MTYAYRRREQNPRAHRAAVQSALRWYRDNPREDVKS